MQMSTSSERKASRIPSHLRPFHPTSSSRQEVEHSYSPPKSTLSPSIIIPEYYYCLVPRRNWRELLTDLLLKDWQGTSRHTALRNPPCRRLSQPLPMQRIKDSDDYLTARAANPRTGLISPSVSAAKTPPPIRTPSTPGEALELLLDPNSPAPDIRPRPPLRRANEGRKVSNENARNWHPDGKGWLIDTRTRAASPRVAHIKANAFASKRGDADDRFVVRMPSAQEPQPYEYPGCSATQIEVCEHRRRKAGWPSSEDYDPRGWSSGRARLRTFEERPSRYRNDYQDIQVSKRRHRVESVEDRSADFDDINAMSFAPFSSPKTPVSAGAEDPTMVMRTLPKDARHHFQRKPVEGRDRRTASEGAAKNVQGAEAERAANLTHLPRVKVAHPSVAAVPHSNYLPPTVDATIEGRRTCSLGCHRDAEGAGCVERRAVSKSAALFGPPLAHDTPGLRPASNPHFSTPQTSHDSTSSLSDNLISLTISIISLCKYLRLPSFPRIGMVEILRSEETTPFQKACALKALLASVGQIVVVLAVLTMLWQVGSVVVHLVEVVLWPLAVPVRILKWVAGVG